MNAPQPRHPEASISNIASGPNSIVRFFGRTTMSFLRFTPALAALSLMAGAAHAAPANSMAAAPAAAKTTKPAKPTMAPATPMMAAKPAMAPAKPMMAAKPAKTAMRAAPRKAVSAPAGRMVTTKTSTGKAITYNCSLAGNMTKKACK
jgi:hypothetical protein